MTSEGAAEKAVQCVHGAVESFFVCPETKLDKELNDKLTVKQNIIFETVVREDPTEGFMTPAAHITRSLLSLN